MRTYFRYCLSVMSEEYPYKAPDYVQKASQLLLDQCKDYNIGDEFVLVPTDSIECRMVMEFKEQYQPYTYKVIIYERKYTKKEMESAEFYLLGSSTIIKYSGLRIGE